MKIAILENITEFSQFHIGNTVLFTVTCQPSQLAQEVVTALVLGCFLVTTGASGHFRVLRHFS